MTYPGDIPVAVLHAHLDDVAFAQGFQRVGVPRAGVLPKLHRPEAAAAEKAYPIEVLLGDVRPLLHRPSLGLQPPLAPDAGLDSGGALTGLSLWGARGASFSGCCLQVNQGVERAGPKSAAGAAAVATHEVAATHGVVAIQRATETNRVAAAEGFAASDGMESPQHMGSPQAVGSLQPAEPWQLRGVAATRAIARTSPPETLESPQRIGSLHPTKSPEAVGAQGIAATPEIAVAHGITNGTDATHRIAATSKR